jgi:hypothetical protein
MPNDIVKADLADRAADRWVMNQIVSWAVGGKDRKNVSELLVKDLDAFTAGLAGPSPSPVERVLVESAGLDWLFLRVAEANMIGGYNSEKGLTFAQSEHAQRRVDRAHRRLLSTLRTLATVRRLGVPAVQINVGAQQVNVAGTI